MFKQATGAALVPQELLFQHARSAHVGLVARKAGCSVRFGQDTTAILLRPSALDLPLATCDAALMNLLLRHGEQVLQQSSSNRSLVGQIEKILIEALPQNYPDAHAVARELGPEFVGFVGLSGVFLFNFRPWLPGGQSSAPNGN